VLFPEQEKRLYPPGFKGFPVLFLTVLATSLFLTFLTVCAQPRHRAACFITFCSLISSVEGGEKAVSEQFGRFIWLLGRGLIMFSGGSKEALSGCKTGINPGMSGM